MKITYRQHQPSPALMPYIAYFWTMGDEGQLSDSQVFMHKCLPLGNAEIVIHLSDEKKSYAKGAKWINLPEAYLVGIWTERASVKIPRGAISFGISIRPEALAQIFGARVGELWNDCMDANLAFGAGFASFANQIREAGTDAERIRLSECYLLGCLNRRNGMAGYVSEAINRIRLTGGNVSIDALSHQVFIGKRQLERTFKEILGVSPKMFGRLARFSKAYGLVNGNPAVSWTDISFDCGYADQAHFIRDFKEFTGEAPTVFFTDKAALAAQPRLAFSA